MREVPLANNHVGKGLSSRRQACPIPPACGGRRETFAPAWSLLALLLRRCAAAHTHAAPPSKSRSRVRLFSSLLARLMGGRDDRLRHEPALLLGITEPDPIVGLEIHQRGGRFLPHIEGGLPRLPTYHVLDRHGLRRLIHGH